MGLIDNYTKKYMSNNEVFSDAFNFYVYGGEQVIKSENLRTVDTTQVGTVHKNELNASVQKIRDNYKVLAAKEDGNGIYLALGIENESNLTYSMPVKNYLYDALEYEKQVAQITKSHKADGETKNIGSGEYLTGFHKDDKLIPVITLVIFWSPDEWTAPRTIHEMFKTKDERVLSFVNDYKINLISPYELSDNDASKLNSNLKEVLLYIKNSKDKNKLRELVNNDEKFSNLDRDAACVINACTNSKLKINENDEVVDMCKAINDLVRDGIAQGKAEGINEGKIIGAVDMCKAFGASVEEAVLKIMDSFNLTKQEANKIVKMYW